MSSIIRTYKQWVKDHPGIIQNLDWLLYLGIWNPGRLNSSESSYEIYHAVVGLLSVWHSHILDEDNSECGRPPHRLWLDLIEQVETIIELRAMHLESLGKMNRYGPLAVLEGSKAFLKIMIWSRYWGHLYLRNPGPEDIDQFESEQGLQDIMSALQRLRTRYTSITDCTTAASKDIVYFASSFLSDLRGWVLSACGFKDRVSCLSSDEMISSNSVEAEVGQQPSSTYHFTEMLQRLPWGHTAETNSVCRSGETSECSTSALMERQHMGQNLIWLGEVLHIFRPLVYVAMLHSHGRSSWKPWTRSLMMDLLSIYFQQRGKWHMLRAAEQQQIVGSTTLRFGSTPLHFQGPHRPTSLLSLALLRGLSSQRWSPGEEMEISERKRKLFLYLLRSPFFENFLKSPFDRLVVRMDRVPLIGALLEYASGLLGTFTEYYTYTSGS